MGTRNLIHGPSPYSAASAAVCCGRDVGTPFRMNVPRLLSLHVVAKPTCIVISFSRAIAIHVHVYIEVMNKLFCWQADLVLTSGGGGGVDRTHRPLPPPPSLRAWTVWTNSGGSRNGAMGGGGGGGGGRGGGGGVRYGYRHIAAK